MRVSIKLLNKMRYTLLFTSITACALFFFFVNLFFFDGYNDNSHFRAHDVSQKMCSSTSEQPVLYLLRTSSGVNYEGGHWFHIAENFMVLHSILRERNMLTNASEIYISVDKSMQYIESHFYRMAITY